MYQDILIPTDGSAGAEEAVARALDLARVSGATVHTLYVVEMGEESAELDAEQQDELREAATNRGESALEEIAEAATDIDSEIRTEVREGTPNEEIRAYAADHGIDLIVMGTHGRTGAERASLGSTTERVVTLGDVPVMSVRRNGDAEAFRSGYGMYDHIVIATDGSDDAERAATHGIEIAERYGADVHVVYVVDTATFDLQDAPRSIVGLLKEGGRSAAEAIMTEARDLNLPAEADVLRGIPEEEILDFADGVDADLLVVGTRGRATTGDRLLGSTTARLIERAEMPVLTR
ncbi:universal stress protein [Halorientalis salina]|uniref:universal stress protein n=1 Tax=Halorientalis salina TaxID=2932266 RepID=UPI0010AD85CE|nr:universal stress protein [Halorientalis salina]